MSAHWCDTHIIQNNYHHLYKQSQQQQVIISQRFYDRKETDTLTRTIVAQTSDEFNQVEGMSTQYPSPGFIRSCIPSGSTLSSY